MSKKEERITIRISEEKSDAAEVIKEDLGMSVAEQFREAYSFWVAVIYSLATDAIEEEDAIDELKKYASVIEGRHNEPRLSFRKVMDEFEEIIQEEKKKGEDEGPNNPLLQI